MFPYVLAGSRPMCTDDVVINWKTVRTILDFPLSRVFVSALESCAIRRCHTAIMYPNSTPNCRVYRFGMWHRFCSFVPQGDLHVGINRKKRATCGSGERSGLKNQVGVGVDKWTR